MPYKPRRQCSGRGPYVTKCPNLVENKETYCTICKEYAKKELKQRNRSYDSARDQTRERCFIHSTQWRKIRLRKLAQNPLCEKCLKEGRETRAVFVHHINKNQLDNSPENHISVCQLCHLNLHKSDVFGNKKK